MIIKEIKNHLRILEPQLNPKSKETIKEVINLRQLS